MSRFFGPLSAEADTTILDYFHKTTQIETLVDFTRPRSSFMFIARPGSGKTAVRKWLQTNSKADLAIPLTSDAVRLYLEDEDDPNAGDLRLLITNELFVAMISEALEKNIVPQHLLKEAKELVSSGLGALAEFFQQKFQGLSILGCGFSLKPGDRRRYLQKVRQSGRLENYAEFLTKLAQKKRLLVIVDNPEEIVSNGLDDLTGENAIRLGAFLSVLSRTNSCGIRVVCFIKEQLVQSVRSHYPDFQHFADQFESLHWSAIDLTKMLETRIKERFKVRWDQVFSFTSAEMQREVFPMLSNGPRDLLFLCNAAGQRSDQIALGDLLANAVSLRNDRMKDFSSQYKQWPKFGQFVSSMIAALQAKFGAAPIPVGGINSLFAELYSKPKSDIHALRNIDWVDNAKWEAPPIDERLFVAGTVGYIEKGNKVYPWDGRDVARFQTADSHFISPLFLK